MAVLPAEGRHPAPSSSLCRGYTRSACAWRVRLPPWRETPLHSWNRRNDAGEAKCNVGSRNARNWRAISSSAPRGREHGTNRIIYCVGHGISHAISLCTCLWWLRAVRRPNAARSHATAAGDLAGAGVELGKAAGEIAMAVRDCKNSNATGCAADLSGVVTDISQASTEMTVRVRACTLSPRESERAPLGKGALVRHWHCRVDTPSPAYLPSPPVHTLCAARCARSTR